MIDPVSSHTYSSGCLAWHKGGDPSLDRSCDFMAHGWCAYTHSHIGTWAQGAAIHVFGMSWMRLSTRSLGSAAIHRHRRYRSIIMKHSHIGTWAQGAAIHVFGMSWVRTLAKRDLASGIGGVQLVVTRILQVGENLHELKPGLSEWDMCHEFSVMEIEG